MTWEAYIHAFIADFSLQSVIPLQRGLEFAAGSPIEEEALKGFISGIIGVHIYVACLSIEEESIEEPWK